MTAGLITDSVLMSGTPLAPGFTHGGYTYISGVRFPGGGQKVYRLNHATLKIDQSRYVCGLYPADDHMVPAVALMPDGTLGVLYTGHGQDGVLRFRKSIDTSPLRLGPEVTALTLTDLTYAILLTHGGNLFAISQEADGGSSGGWDIAKSDDLGATWSRKKRLYRGTTGFSTAQFYFRPSAVNGDLVTCFCHAHPSNSQVPIAVLTLNLATGEVITSAGSAGTIEDGTNDTPLASYNSMQSLRTSGSGRSQTVVSVLPDGSRILIIDNVTADGSDAKIYLGKLTAAADPTLTASWTFAEIANGAGSIPSIIFDRRDPTGNTLFAVRFDTPDYTVERWTSADAGETWTTAETITTTETRILKPLSPVGAGDAIPVLWTEGTYTDFDTQDLDTRWAAA